VNIFLIDDHEVMRDSLARYLAVMGHRICGMASNAEEALAELAEAPVVDLAIVDVSLPGMSGISLVSELRDRRPEVRCVMLSGHSQERYVKRALEAGAHGYLVKGTADLLERIEEFASPGGTGSRVGAGEGRSANGHADEGAAACNGPRPAAGPPDLPATRPRRRRSARATRVSGNGTVNEDNGGTPVSS
jgi:DNA-binding NarL/FixJ family response regulator